MTDARAGFFQREGNVGKWAVIVGVILLVFVIARQAEARTPFGKLTGAK